MLNAELKYMNSILTQTSFFQMCEGWVEGSGDGVIGRAVGPICKLKGIQGGGRTDLMWCIQSMMIGVSVTGR